MCGYCFLSELFPISELLQPVCFKVRNSTSMRKMGGGAAEEDWETEGEKPIRHICKECVAFLVTVGIYGVVTDMRADVLKACDVCCVSFPSTQVKTDFSTTAIPLSYVRCKACLVQSHMRKLLISAWNYNIPQPPDTRLQTLEWLTHCSNLRHMCVFFCATQFTWLPIFLPYCTHFKSCTFGHSVSVIYLPYLNYFQHYMS